MSADQLQILGEVLVVLATLVVIGVAGNRIGPDTVRGVGTIYLGYLVSVALATFFLDQEGSQWQDIGMNLSTDWLRNILLGIGIFVGAIVATVLVQMVALNLPGLALEPIDQSRFNPIAGNLPLFVGAVVAAWTIIAFGEEMIWRAFLITQLDTLFSETTIGLIVAVIISSLAFGSAHYVEGPVGIASTALIGLVFAIAYLEFNLWVTIIAHGMLNTLRFALLFVAKAEVSPATE